jgi:membrane-associated protease RseP (regulator of RpoE activity)
MVDVQTWLGIGFVIIMSVLLYRYRSKLQVTKLLFPLLYFVMWRTTWGLDAMDWLGSKLRRPIRWLGYAGIVVGFLGMAFITYSLLSSTVMLFLAPSAAPGIQPVLPFPAKGVFFVPFAYWILSIFIIAVVHEFAHGVVARAHNIKVKSSGFAFLGIIAPLIPAAFVEPDEQTLSKRTAATQWSVFAAGPFANILLALLIVFAFGIDASPALPHSITGKTALFDLTNFGNDFYQLSGLQITSVTKGTPGENAGLKVGDVITEVNYVSVSDRERFANALEKLKPGTVVHLFVSGRDVVFTLGQNPQDATRGYIGIGLGAQTEIAPAAIAKYGSFGASILSFFASLIIWVFILSLGIGVFNLIPLGPIDGGRMFKLAAEKFFGSRGERVWKVVSMVILGLIFVNLVAGFFH